MYVHGGAVGGTGGGGGGGGGGEGAAIPTPALTAAAANDSGGGTTRIAKFGDSSEVVVVAVEVAPAGAGGVFAGGVSGRTGTGAGVAGSECAVCIGIGLVVVTNPSDLAETGDRLPAGEMPVAAAAAAAAAEERCESCKVLSLA